MKKICCILLFVILGLFMLIGCTQQGNADMAENENIHDKLIAHWEELREEGIQILASWEENGVLIVEVFGGDQRAINGIAGVMGNDMSKIQIREQREVEFIEGIISDIEVSSGDNPTVYGTIFVEGDENGAEDKAYISITDFTRILKVHETYDSAMGFEALELGMKVEVMIVGAILQSYPSRASASTLIVKN